MLLPQATVFMENRAVSHEPRLLKRHHYVIRCVAVEGIGRRAELQ